MKIEGTTDYNRKWFFDSNQLLKQPTCHSLYLTKRNQERNIGFRFGPALDTFLFSFVCLRTEA